MYKFDRNHQCSLSDFDQPMGLKMNPDNRWVRKASTIPWKEIEDRYAKLFPGIKGMPAKPLQTALGSLIIQKQYGYSEIESLLNRFVRIRITSTSSGFPVIRIKSRLYLFCWLSFVNALLMMSCAKSTK